MNTDIIRLLPDSVANQIAAGEVIQGPSSVIKELVENSVDAGATSIQIILKDAGRTLIQVVDNGKGMSPTDARMAFERHATSKIASAADLYSLHTMGFRGEALPSIAAVAQIELRTMRKDDSIGTCLMLSESKFESQEPAACVPGTNLMVKNLFFHMPARRKFLKNDNVELSHILHEFERLALVNTNLDFTLIHNGVTRYQFRAESLKQRIGSLFGKNVESQLAPIATETSLVKISGFIGMPRSAKKRGAQQFFFVNGRNMKHPFFHKAVLKCYDRLIAPDAKPSYFINFEVDPSTIDVNIHPQKHEVKFEHEQAIWQILEAAVRETLGKTQAAGALDFDADDAPDIPLYDPDAGFSAPDEGFDENYNPFDTPDAQWQPQTSAHSQTARWERPSAQPVHDWQKLYENFNRERDDAYASAPVIPDTASGDNLFGEVPGSADAGSASSACFRMSNGYIVTGSRRGIMVIAQRRAHIRILFERFMTMLEGGAMPSQALLFPEDMELSPSQSSMLEASLDRFSALGFRIVATGNSKWSVNAIPAPMQGSNPGEIILSLLEEMTDSDGKSAEALFRPLALAMASAAAVSASAPLSPAEIDSLVADLFRCKEPSFTPDGLPLMTLIENDEIERRLNPS